MTTVRLADIACVLMGTAPPGSSYNETGEGVALIAGAGDFGGKHPEPKKWTTEPSRVSEPGDLLVCVRATIGDLNWADREYCLGRGVAGVRVNGGLAESGYVARFLDAHKQQLAKLGTGSTFPAIRRADLEDFPIYCPPLPVQKRIAAILDAADALRAKRRESIEQLDSLVQATFLEMFGDPVTNPKGWEATPLIEIGEYISGATPSKQQEGYWGGSNPWVSPKDMKVNYIRDSQDHVTDLALRETGLKRIDPFHLLVVVRGMILAHSFPVALNLVPVAINQDMKAIRLRTTLDPRYALVCLQQKTRELLAEVSTAGHGTKRFDAKGFKSVMMPHPPLDLQTRFASIVESIEQQKARLKAHLAELDTLFASLQSRAFNGELVA